MNPMAIDLYKKNGIDITKEPLEVAVCAQHNNGGLLGDIWWESNISHLFPIGEVNGSHGVYRPGGSALNSGQVGSLRAAQRIVKVYNKVTIKTKQFDKTALPKAKEILSLVDGLKKRVSKKSDVLAYRDEFQCRMSEFGAHIRSQAVIDKAVRDAYLQMDRFNQMSIKSISEIPEAMKNRHLVLAHAAYLEAVAYYLKNGGGSRGSYMVMDNESSSNNALTVLQGILDDWKYKPENTEFRSKMLETVLNKTKFDCTFSPRRPMPEQEYWFENVWGDFVKGKVFE
jgi:succinate dehydrogenase/fumarate reductase flavoprotein subunit